MSVEGELFEKSSPSPPQKLARNKYLNKFVSALADGRREVKPRFGSRKLAGATKTLLVKKVVDIKKTG